MDDYYFPMKVDELEPKDGEDYFSIIHVDGNNMGWKFRDCKNLLERRQLSREIRRKTESAFADLLRKIIAAQNADIFNEVLDLKDKKILPIRPMIIGGDDVTFICPAKTAILFTKTLMESLNAVTPENSPEHLTKKHYNEGISTRELRYCLRCILFSEATKWQSKLENTNILARVEICISNRIKSELIKNPATT